MTKAEEKARAKIKADLKKYMKIIESAKEKKINESDTRFIVNEILGVLGYDKFFDVTTEYKVKGHFVDYAVKGKGQIHFFIEVKSVDTELNENHLYQVVTYAANEGVEWVILTNSAVWQIYHLIFSKPIDKQLVFSLDLLDKDIKPAKKVELLYLLSKEGIARNELQKYLDQKLALSGANLAAILLSPSMLEKARRELKTKTGFSVSADEIKVILKKDVFKDEIKGEAVYTRPKSKVSRKKKVTSKPEEQPQPIVEQATEIVHQASSGLENP